MKVLFFIFLLFGFVVLFHHLILIGLEIAFAVGVAWIAIFLLLFVLIVVTGFFSATTKKKA